MKKLSKVNKGAPSGFVISLAIHAAAFFLAGLFVVFTVTQKEEKKFVPPKPVDRPKMKLKKPKVKVKKSAKPKATTRIVTKVQKASMPDIQLPEMSGMAEGMVGDIGGFEIMPDLEEVTVFGAGQTIGNDFVGTFYDLKRFRSGEPNSFMTSDKYKETVENFLRYGWKPSRLSKFYRSPKKLYATSFMVPTMRSYTAPAAFGENTGGWYWMAHYTGQLVYKDDIRFRFWGQGDDVLVVRVGGKVVLNGSWYSNMTEYYPLWNSTAAESRLFTMGNNVAEVGDWIELKAGEPVEMEVLCGERPGGHFDMMLCVEVDGEEYERNSQQGPILPMFKTAVPSHSLCDAIYEYLIPGEASVTNGPVFCDFDTTPKKMEQVLPEPSADAAADADTAEDSSLRAWMIDGRDVEAAYAAQVGTKILLKSAQGKQLEVQFDQFSDEDKEYLMLANPPRLDSTFVKQSEQITYPVSPDSSTAQPRSFDWTFGVKLKQISPRAYDKALKLDFTVIGTQEADENKFYIIDRASSEFSLTDENGRSFTHKCDTPSRTTSYVLNSQTYGRKFKGYVLTVTDQRGEVIYHAASSEWFFEKLEQLNQLPLGAFFDDTGNRVYPTGPKADY